MAKAVRGSNYVSGEEEPEQAKLKPSVVVGFPFFLPVALVAWNEWTDEWSDVERDA